MANNQIIISRIQNRRGRRENLPQPLLPGEFALTSDTGQVWVGNDPDLSVPSINVYSDKSQTTAQTIIDNNIVEARFDETFGSANFQTLRTELLGSLSVTLFAEDVLYDDTARGSILSITVDTPGTGYTTGDVITAISTTGSGFVGTVTAGGGGDITGVNVINVGQNYTSSNTTFTVANGTGGALSVAASDIQGPTVHVAVRPSLDAGNSVATIKTEIAATSVASLLTTVDAAGGWAYGDDTGGVDRSFNNGSLIANNHTEADNVVALINRVNSDTPTQVTGLVYTGLNTEVTSQRTFPFITGFYFDGIETVNDALKVTFLPTQDIYFENDDLSRAYATIPSSAQQIYDIQKNGVSVGSITFETGVSAGTVTFTTKTDFTPTDRLEIYTPSAVDGTINQVAITLNGYIVLT